MERERAKEVKKALVSYLYEGGILSNDVVDDLIKHLDRTAIKVAEKSHETTPMIGLNPFKSNVVKNEEGLKQIDLKNGMDRFYESLNKIMKRP